MRILQVLSLVLMLSATAMSQSPATAEHEHLKFDVGTWTGTMSMQPPGTTEPMSMPVKEVNRMMDGGLWLLSEMESGPFKGHGQFGYDAAKKKYVGTWVDNSSGHLNVMEGSLDKKSGEMTMTFTGVDHQTGKPVEMKSVATRDGQDKRKFVMYAKEGDQWVKSFQIDYKRSK